jgi:hypothetical protein
MPISAEFERCDYNSAVRTEACMVQNLFFRSESSDVFCEENNPSFTVLKETSVEVRSTVLQNSH